MLTEDSKAGSGFLAGLARDWEAEASKAEALEIRVVLARIGIVLAKQGGALPKMMLPFKIGAGGRIGSGQQWMSWVTLEEVVGILRFAIENATVRGAVNVVAPQSVRNAEFTKVLAKTIRRPARMRWSIWRELRSPRGGGRRREKSCCGRAGSKRHAHW